jgi:hypothetical protein
VIDRCELQRPQNGRQGSLVSAPSAMGRYSSIRSFWMKVDARSELPSRAMFFPWCAFRFATCSGMLPLASRAFLYVGSAFIVREKTSLGRSFIIPASGYV